MIHLATAAVLNAVWDLWARAEGKVGADIHSKHNNIKKWCILLLYLIEMSHCDAQLIRFVCIPATVEAAGRHGESVGNRVEEKFSYKVVN